MRQLIGVLLISLMALSSVTALAEDLTEEQQRLIIQRYMYVTGQLPSVETALSDIDSTFMRPEKCGTPAILDYYQNLNRLDRRTRAALGVEDFPRPTMQYSYGLPGGHVLIHYNTSGTHEIWRSGVDTDIDGVPDYVEQLAAIGDSCYVHIIDTLGYRLPLDDSGCVEGGDSRIDIYVQALPFGFYGMTHNQSECYEPSEQHEASWIIIDHDFQHLPEYAGNAIDAARVTIAHEMFHTVHFAIDATEHATWFEMSAVWMEEEIYDEINDYQLYDYVFYDHPRIGLADTVIAGHMYQAAVFPIFITEKYGRDAVRAVWDRAGAMGPGPQYLAAFDQVIDSAAADPANARYDCLCYLNNGVTCLDSVLIEENFSTAMIEFAVWNYFTGSFAEMAPDGIGYSEASQYAEIPLDSMDLRVTYPFRVGVAANLFKPQANAAVYIRLDNLESIAPDSMLTFYVGQNNDASIRWGLAAIYQLRDDLDSHLVVMDVVENWETPNCVSGWECTEWNADSSLCLDSTCANLGIPFRIRYVNEIVGEKKCLNGEFGNDLLCYPTCQDSALLIDTRKYRSVTLVLTPTTLSTGPYSFGDYIGFSYVSADSASVVDVLTDLPPSILTPYPNPAVVAEMGDQGLGFRFQVPTDETSFPAATTAVFQLDIFSVAGELVRTLQQDQGGISRTDLHPGGAYEVVWDMKNDGGHDVASGAYLAVARLYDTPAKTELLATEQVKVAVIR